MHTQQLSNASNPIGLACFPTDAWHRLKRSLLLALGLMLIAIGFVGIFLPGVPTTGPLLGASFLLAKSNPRLERKLLSSRVFRNYAQFMDGSREIPLRARLAALLSMWTSIAISCSCLGLTGRVPSPVLGVIIALGLVGTPFILWYRRSRQTTVARPERSAVSPVSLLH